MRILGSLFVALIVGPLLYSQGDWPVYGHDAGGQRYSPLTQINAKNVSKLKLAWQYGIDAAGIDLTPANRVLSGTEAVPIMVNGILYAPRFIAPSWRWSPKQERRFGNTIWGRWRPRCAASPIGRAITTARRRSWPVRATAASSP